MSVKPTKQVPGMGGRMEEMLDALREHGGVMTGIQIREWLGYKPHTLYETAQRLLQRGLVTAHRIPHHTNPRGGGMTVQYRLTENQ